MQADEGAADKSVPTKNRQHRWDAPPRLETGSSKHPPDLRDLRTSGADVAEPPRICYPASPERGSHERFRRRHLRSASPTPPARSRARAGNTDAASRGSRSRSASSRCGCAAKAPASAAEAKSTGARRGRNRSAPGSSDRRRGWRSAFGHNHRRNIDRSTGSAATPVSPAHHESRRDRTAGAGAGRPATSRDRSRDRAGGLTGDFRTDRTRGARRAGGNRVPGHDGADGQPCRHRGDR